MNLKDILAISGKPGLFRLVSRARGGVIVESLKDGKRMPVTGTGGVSALEDIAMFTIAEEIPLSEVMRRIAEKENEGKAPDYKADGATLKAYFEQLLPDYDRERVHESHLRKLFQWYNILQEQGLVSKIMQKEDVSQADNQQ